jgi:hypothetical protein
MATKVNLFPSQGATYQHVFLYRNKATGAAISVAGWTIEMQVRPFAQSAELLFDGDTAAKGNVEITDGANGEVTITLPAATTATWRNNEAVYDIKGTPPAGEPERIAEGSVYLSKATTR